VQDLVSLDRLSQSSFRSRRVSQSPKTEMRKKYQTLYRITAGDYFDPIRCSLNTTGIVDIQCGGDILFDTNFSVASISCNRISNKRLRCSHEYADIKNDAATSVAHEIFVECSGRTKEEVESITVVLPSTQYSCDKYDEPALVRRSVGVDRVCVGYGKMKSSQITMFEPLTTRSCTNSSYQGNGSCKQSWMCYIGNQNLDPDVPCTTHLPEVIFESKESPASPLCSATASWNVTKSPIDSTITKDNEVSLITTTAMSNEKANPMVPSYYFSNQKKPSPISLTSILPNEIRKYPSVSFEVPTPRLTESPMHPWLPSSEPSMIDIKSFKVAPLSLPVSYTSTHKFSVDLEKSCRDLDNIVFWAGRENGGAQGCLWLRTMKDIPKSLCKIMEIPYILCQETCRSCGKVDDILMKQVRELQDR
jgi:hypothetical protein